MRQTRAVDDRRGIADPGLRHAGLILVILCSAQTILAIDVTVVNVAGASIERALGFTEANLQWMVTAYSLTFGGFLLLGGRMADIFGRRRLFLAGVTGFGLASLLAGTSHNTVELIAARAIQGLCAAITSPTVLAILAATFADGRARQRAYSIWATAGSLGGLMGFLVGGIITTALGWRWIFFINIPIAALAVTGTILLVPKDRVLDTRRPRLDVPGALTVTAALALVIYGLGEAQSTSWSDDRTLIALCAAPFLLVAFILVERHSREPLLPFALLRRRAAFGNLIIILQQAMATSTVFLSPLFMQQVWGFSAGKAGVATLPVPIGFGIGARLGPRLGAKMGTPRLVGLGFILVSIGLLWVALSLVSRNYWVTFLPGLFVRSIGQGLVMVPIVLTVTSGVPRETQGVAAGLYNMSQQLGGALGLAALATVAAAAANGFPGGAVAGEGHGIRLAIGLCSIIAFLSCLLSLAVLRPSAPAPPLEDDASLTSETEPSTLGA